jgi:hypothetical protein
MNTLRKSDAVSSSTTAPAAPAAVTLDEFGRDPSSPPERLRRQTNYQADSGYAPFYAAWVADLPRLSSGQVCTIFLMVVNVLSLGRPDNVKGKRRHVWTRPVSVEELAGLCRCHVRDVQRQIKDLDVDGGRGLIAVKHCARGLYQFSLLYLGWRKLPDYQPAGRLAAVDDPEPGDGDGAVELDGTAVRLVRRPLKVNAGKTARSVPLNGVVVSSLRCQNSATLPLVYDAVVQGGQLLISTRLASDWREVLDSEHKANESRRTCREGGEVAGQVTAADPRARDVVEVFDPLLERTGERLLIGDAAALAAAVAAMGEMPRKFLEGWLEGGKRPRSERPVSGPRVVASIIAEAYKNWAATRPAAGKPGPAAAGGRAAATKRPASFVEAVMREGKRRFERFGKV